MRRNKSVFFIRLFKVSKNLETEIKSISFRNNVIFSKGFIKLSLTHVVVLGKYKAFAHPMFWHVLSSSRLTQSASCFFQYGRTEIKMFISDAFLSSFTSES